MGIFEANQHCVKPDPFGQKNSNPNSKSIIQYENLILQLTLPKLVNMVLYRSN